VDMSWVGLLAGISIIHVYTNQNRADSGVLPGHEIRALNDMGTT